jgi:alpha-L-fucosidase
MKNIILLFSVCLSMILLHNRVDGQYAPSKENLKNREWFEKAKLGMFVHYGVYTHLDDPDEAWAMRKYPLAEYEKMAEDLDPSAFDAKKWVSQAKAMGFRFITVTTKHHDGFCLFDSKYTDWTIMHHGKRRIDMIRELANECHRQGMKLHLYYSLLDWHHPDFVFHKEDGGVYDKRPVMENRDEQRYIQYMKDQLTELLTNYGKIDGIWFDGYWSKNVERWPFADIYGLIHQLQPACMIVNNHDMFYIDGEDCMVYALYDPFPQKDYDSDSRLQKMSLEAMDMSTNKWGYYSKQVYKPVDTLIRNMERVAAKHATFVLNTGPLPDGSLDRRFMDTMKLVRAGIRKNEVIR